MFLKNLSVLEEDVVVKTGEDLIDTLSVPKALQTSFQVVITKATDLPTENLVINFYSSVDGTKFSDTSLKTITVVPSDDEQVVLDVLDTQCIGYIRYKCTSEDTNGYSITLKSMTMTI
jgi:hypothetical protein